MARNAVDRLSDGLPEHYSYRDDGCGRGCLRSLECPYPRCRYDDPLVWQRIEREERAQKVLAIRAAEGQTVDALAQRFGISVRTVHRILARAKDKVQPVKAASKEE